MSEKEKRYSVPGSKLVAIADLIRRRERSSQKYTIDDMRTVLGELLESSGGTGLACTHNTSVLYVPAPRYTTGVDITLPNITHKTSVLYVPAPRYVTEVSIALPNVAHNTSSMMTTRHTLTTLHITDIPIITHETEVAIIYG